MSIPAHSASIHCDSPHLRPLNCLTGAQYSTGESFAYQYDAVGNRTAMTDTSGIHTYTYDDANRLTSVDGVGYTWDARGNLIGDGTFTYAYDAAGRMVRAESLTATLVYTYNTNGLRVAQSIDGDVTTFAWDWASAVPEMLRDGSSLYLVGHDTLGRWDGDEWVYHLPDALGSVRQVVDGAGMVTSAREWTPYGVEVGAAQVGLGYTGEWWDADAARLYLRARWYEPGVGRFTRRDPWEGHIQQPQTFNDFTYAAGNPINQTHPSLSGPPTLPPDSPTPTPTPTPPDPIPLPKPDPWPRPTPPPPPPPVPDAVLLEHSVRVFVYDAIEGICIPLDSRVPPPGQGYAGLGTIIYTGDTVLTHNHYHEGDPTLWREADFVDFTTHLQNQLDLPPTRVRIDDIGRRFRDNPGTLLLELPSWVNLWGTAATLGDPDTLSPGDWTQVVYYDDAAEQMRVWMRSVRELGDWQGEPTAIFLNLSDDLLEIIDPGDSGGGVFKEGRLVANNWWRRPYDWPWAPLFASALLPDGV